MTLLVHVLVVAAATLSSASACTPPFESVGTGCYYFSELTTKNWDDARDFCKSLSPGADLAMLNDCHQHNLVWSHIFINYELVHHWIGAIDKQQDGGFFWMDGTAVSMGMPFWYPDQPSGESCVALWAPTGYFNDNPCEKKYKFVCQQP